MDDETKQKLRALVRERITKQGPQIDHSLRQIDAGNPLGAEPSKERSVAYIAKNAKLPTSDALAMTAMIARTADLIEDGVRDGIDRAESSRGPTIDLIGVDFLGRGRQAANAVGRVAFRSSRYEGSGFLVGDGLFLTNNHVIPSPEAATRLMVEFDYEAALDGSDAPVTSFAFDPVACFVTDLIDRLDFTLIAIGQRLRGSKPLDAFGHIPLSDAKDKHMLGILANIIQHPLGDLKKIVVRDNNLISRDETVHVLHYLADTEMGSSGSPVCNNRWEPIALHHWGEAFLEIKDARGRPLPKDVNEGIRISSVVAELRTRLPKLTAPTADRVARVIELWDTTSSGVEESSSKDQGAGTASAGSAKNADAVEMKERTTLSERSREVGHEVTWTFPIEITVRAPLLGPGIRGPQGPTGQGGDVAPLRGSEARRKFDFSDRGGYDPGFIPGFVVPLPDYREVGYTMARNREPSPNAEDPYELPYHHFSIVMRADRRLAAFTACNIDGRRLAAVNREDKSVILDPDLGDLGAEASDAFTPDPRVNEDEQMAVEFYEEQEVPGHPKPDYPGKSATKAEKSTYAKLMAARSARMFQKGHITLRGDPAWGQEDEAREAEADTFFYTNAAPQIGFFNQGSAEKRPGSKGKLRWRAVETYVLRNAFTMRQRVSVFAGPVFDDSNDIPYRLGYAVPKKFWKVAVWGEKKKLKSIALIADQKIVLDKMTEGVPESFQSEEEIARVSEFLTTVKKLEEITKLSFGDAVRKADVRGGAEGAVPAIDASPEEIFQ